MEEIPTLVETDLEALESLVVRLGRLPSRLLPEQLVLLVRQLVDPLDDLLVVHDSHLPFPRFSHGFALPL